jgi:hypothetical protein
MIDDDKCSMRSRLQHLRWKDRVGDGIILRVPDPREEGRTNVHAGCDREGIQREERAVGKLTEP